MRGPGGKVARPNFSTTETNKPTVSALNFGITNYYELYFVYFHREKNRYLRLFSCPLSDTLALKHPRTKFVNKSS